jgi:hypothetical protein
MRRMFVLRRDRQWVWVGRVVAVLVLVGLSAYLARVGLDDADKLASSMSVVVAVAALLVPYLLPPPQSRGTPVPEPDRAEDTGNATGTGGGWANTGHSPLTAAGGAGDADGRRGCAGRQGSIANTGIQRRPGPNR